MIKEFAAVRRSIAEQDEELLKLARDEDYWHKAGKLTGHPHWEKISASLNSRSTTGDSCRRRCSTLRAKHELDLQDLERLLSKPDGLASSEHPPGKACVPKLQM